jgi:penicillin-binding protein 1C
VWSAVTATLGARHALVAGDCNQRVPSAECRSSRFISPVSAALVLDILADPMARVSGFGIDTPLDFPFPTAAKTGTSRHFTDNWAVATTGGFTVAVWVGNFSGRPMDGVSGVTGAGPLLHRAVMLTAARYAPGVLPTPRSAGAVAVDICRLSGMRATAECPRTTEWFAPGTEPTAPCDWHRDGRVVLPAEYTEWSVQHAAETGTRALATATAATTDSAPARFRITSPVDGDRYQVPPGVDARYATVALRASGAADPTAVRWFVDGHPTADARFRLRPGPHVIRARVSSDSDEVHVIVE